MISNNTNSKLAKDNANKLSLKQAGCNASCCKHGSPYVLPQEKNNIVEATGMGVFIKKGEYYIIGLNKDYTKRNMDDSRCPFLTADDYCGLQKQDPSLKPADCYMHPLFPKFNKTGEYELYVSPCCDTHKCLSDEFIDCAINKIESLPLNHAKRLYDMSFENGFELVKFITGKDNE